MRLFSFVLFVLMCKLIPGQQVNLQSTNLPLFLIETNGQTISDDPKIVASLKIISNSNGINKPADNANIYNGKIGIEYRGSYSQMLPQKPYGFETLDSLENEDNVSLLGFPKENDWILLAAYNDKSFVRNTLMFDLFRQMGHYAPKTKHCELLINNDYQGIYIFTEKIKQDKNRVDISKLDLDDNVGDSLTGGYIFKVDYSDGSDSWTSEYTPENFNPGSVNFIYTYPKPDEITLQQKNYISSYVDNFEDVLFGNGFKDPTSGYRAFIDVDSWVDYFIIGEVSRNVDAYKKSCHYYKQSITMGGLIYAGPVWDFDWAMKNFDECIYGNTDGSGWAYEILNCTNPWPYPVPPAWMPRLLEDSYFANRIHTRYRSLRNTILNNNYIYNYIDSVATLLNTAQERHYTKWPILGENVGTHEVDYIPDTFEGETEKFKNWFAARLAWLDDNMVGEPISTSEPEFFTDRRIKVFPIPANDVLNVQSGETLQELSILSIDGNTLQTIDINNLYYSTINVDNLAPGLYLLKAVTSNNELIIKKFIKV